ncbi:DUF2167 domain-containing protein, partial [Salmonella enterica subsp. enterica serovar Lubbock]|nr:DUF2167 domain-containing protein [Salmonella enterica subsp. enterica serovar Lubbock]
MVNLKPQKKSIRNSAKNGSFYFAVLKSKQCVDAVSFRLQNNNKKEMNGFISIEYDDSGYVKDDDAKNWDADELMDNLRKGTKEA